MAPRPRSSFENRRKNEMPGNFPQAQQVRSRALTEEYIRRHQERLEAQSPPHLPERFTAVDLGFRPTEGEPSLPVAQYKNEILASVAEHQVTIITAETGAGKSTQIPQYLLERGYKVSMTQPRRLSASFVAERITDEVDQALINEDLPVPARNLVGYRTAGHTNVQDGVRLEVVTDGLELLRQFSKRDELQDEVLIVDEVHEWNANIEMIIARLYQMLREKPELRVVIMSATMEAEKLAKYFRQATNSPVPVMEIPGRNYEVTRHEIKNSTVVEQAVHYAKADENCLIFLPGVKEITKTIEQIKRRTADLGLEDVVVLPLHSKLSKEEQDAVRGFYAGPKIICATNIAQTSITIPDVNVVIDSGVERRKEIDDQATQGLHLRLASRADMNQRAGRTGRVAPGTYIHTRLDEDTPFVPFDHEDRLDYPVPEILRTNVNRNTLLAASAGIDFRKLKLFHPVKRKIIDMAQVVLKSMGALDELGEITPRGERMVRLPMRPEYSRMIVEAEDQGFPASLRTQAVAMVSVMEMGGLVSWVEGASRDWRNLSDEQDSDFITQLDVFVQTHAMDDRSLTELGLDVKNVERSKELFSKIAYRLGLKPSLDELTMPTPDERERLKEIITLGLIDSLYARQSDRQYVAVDSEADSNRRNLSGRTTISELPKLLVGTPYRIEKRQKGHRVVEHVIQDGTATTNEIIAKVAVQQTVWLEHDLKLSQERIVRIEEQFLKGLHRLGVIREVEATYSPTVEMFVVHEMITRPDRDVKRLLNLKHQIDRWQHRTTEKLNTISDETIEAVIKEAVRMNPNVLDIVDINRRVGEIMETRQLDMVHLLPLEVRRHVQDTSPDTIFLGDREYKLSYFNSVPSFKTDSIFPILNWEKAPRLPDGREIRITYGKRTLDLKSWRREARRDRIA